MKITIDTQNDSKKDILRAIELLKNIVQENNDHKDFDNNKIKGNNHDNKSQDKTDSLINDKIEFLY